MRQAVRQLVLAGLLGAVGLACAPPARAQVETREGIYLQNQILDLRRQLDTLHNGGLPAPVPMSPRASAPGVSGDLVATLLDRVQALEEQLRDLRGQVEGLRNAETTGTADLSKQIADLNFRVQTLENGGRPPVAAGGPMSPPPGNLVPPPGAPVAQAGAALATAAPVVPRRTPELVLQDGYGALGRHDYKAAETAAREARGMVGPRNANANFLLAQAMAGQRNWPAAAVAYNDSYDAAHTGAHAQDSLLGLANSLVALGDNRAACDALAKLNHEFPRTREDLREPISATRGHAGCR